MRTASSAFNTYNSLNNKNVVFAMEFGSSNTKFVSGTFADFTSPPMGVTYKKLVVGLRLNFPELQLREFHYTPATYEVDLDDNNAEVTAFLNANRLYSAACVLKIGFQEINYADFLTVTISGAQFTDMRIDNNLKRYTLFARDTLFDLLSKTMQHPSIDSGIFNPSKLNATLTAGFTTRAELVDTRDYGVQADFSNLATLDSRVFTAARIGNELIRYETKDDAFDYLNTLTRGLGFTSDVEHTTNESVYAAIGFKCDPMRIFLHVFMNTAAASNGIYDLGIDTSSDDLKQNFYPAISLTTGQIDVTTIERLGWKHFQEYEYDAEGYLYIVPATAENLVDFIESYFLKPFGFFLYTKDGKICIGSIDVIDFIENFSAAATLDSSNIEAIEAIDFTPYEEAREEWHYHNSQFNWATKSFGSSGLVTFLLPGLDETMPQASQYEINAYGADLSAAGSTVSKQAYLNILRHYFFGEVAMLVQVRCKYSTCTLEIGDRVYLTLSQFPNLQSGARGLTQARALIVAQQFDLAAKTVTHTLRIFEIPGYLKDQVTSYYSVNKIAEGSITDKTLSVSATETATTEAADAYYDNSGTQHSGDIIMFRLRITPPNFGGGSTNEIIALKFSFLNTTPAIVVSDYRRYISFNPQSATAFEIDVYVANDDTTYPAGLNKPDRVKVDWISTTATGSEVPTVELIGVWFIVLNI